MPSTFSKRFLLYLGLLLGINLIQAGLMDLIYDEAYYWHYAQTLDWGYFDHPPMVALMIKISSFFFGGELGVRFIGVLMGVLGYALVWKLISQPEKEKYINLYFLLGLGLTLVHAYGFFTLPDTPLLFFTIVFLLVYKSFLQKATWLKALAMGVVMAALMYSKYHAVLVILFTLASNLSLLRNKYAWFAVLISLLAYAPHLWWLYSQEFVSIEYHLFERPNRAYEFADFTLGYIVNLVALFGLLFPFFYAALFKQKLPKGDRFNRALVFLSYGIIIFFFLSSLNRRVQTQWMIVMSIPMFIITFQWLLAKSNWRKWAMRLGMVQLVLLGYARLWLVFPVLLPLHYEAHGNEQWVNDLKEQVGDKGVVFENSYRDAPMYAFYSGANTFSLNNLMYRRNQYSIDGSEAQLQHKDVAYLHGNWNKKADKPIHITKSSGKELKGHYIDNFESYRKLRTHVVTEGTLPYNPGEEITFSISNPYSESIPLKKLRFGISYQNQYKQICENHVVTVSAPEGIDELKPGETMGFKAQLPLAQMKNEKYKKKKPSYFKVLISENGLLLGLNGNNVPLH
jgi:preprotein translocase subunit Sss1